MNFILNRWRRMGYPDQYTTGDWLFLVIFGAAELGIFIGGAILLAQWIH